MSALVYRLLCVFLISGFVALSSGDDRADEEAVHRLLYKPRTPTNKQFYSSTGVVPAAFKYKDCQFPYCHSSLDVRSMRLKPDPVTLPGQIEFSIDYYARNTVYQPLALEVYPVKKLIGGTWYPVPYHYLHEDACTLMTSASVRCPIQWGTYGTFSWAGFVHANFSSGDYEVKVSLFQREKEMACLLFNVAVLNY